MRSAHDATVHLRLPRDLRADLDGAARETGFRLSVVARNALTVGLASIRSSNDDRGPRPPGAPSTMPAAA